MKLLAKTKLVLYSNKAETIAEVLVAFLVLSIVMALFAQGLRFAAGAESYSINNSKSYDNAMIELQKTLSGKEGKASKFGETKDVTLNGMDGKLKLNVYQVPLDGGDSDCCYYCVFDVDDAQTAQVNP